MIFYFSRFPPVVLTKVFNKDDVCSDIYLGSLHFQINFPGRLLISGDFRSANWFLKISLQVIMKYIDKQWASSIFIVCEGSSIDDEINSTVLKFPSSALNFPT